MQPEQSITPTLSPQVPQENLSETIAVPQICSRRRRFFAYFIDTIILSLLINIVRYISEETLFYSHPSSLTFSFFVLPWIITFLYFSLFPISSWWATPGQRLMNTYICDATALSRIGIIKSCLRTLLLSILWIVSFTMTSIVVIGLDFNKIKHTFKTGIQYKHNMVIENSLFYTESFTHLTSFHDPKNDQYIHFVHPLSSVVVMGDKNNATSTVVLVNDEIYDSKQNSEIPTILDQDDDVVSNDQIENKLPDQNLDKTLSQNGDILLSLFFTMLKVISYSIFTFLILLIFPTFIGIRKQTLYDMLCNVIVLRGSKP